MSVKDWDYDDCKYIEKTVLFRHDRNKKKIVFVDGTSIIVKKVNKYVV